MEGKRRERKRKKRKKRKKERGKGFQTPATRGAGAALGLFASQLPQIQRPHM